MPGEDDGLETTHAKERILVTGGCGFVGANLIRRLLAEGRQVRVADDLSTGRREYLDGCPVELIVGDVFDPERARQVLQGVTHVVHLAGATSVRDSLIDPVSSVTMNVVGLVSLLRAAADAGIRGFIFASSTAAVGRADPPVSEVLLPRPVSPYGASKLAGEAYCWAFAESYGVPVVILRFANVYGPYSLHKTNAVHKFIRLVLNGNPLTIYGDGRQTRDFVYADDICAAISLALDLAPAGELFQIGTGVETSLLDLVQALERANGHPIALRYEPPDPREVLRSGSDTRKARAVLGFQSQTKIEEGIARTLKWYKSQMPDRSSRTVISGTGD